MNCNSQGTNDGFENARRIINEAQRGLTHFGCCSFPTNGGGSTGPTGPSGATGPTGPTGRFFKSSNKNNHRYKLNNSL